MINKHTKFKSKSIQPISSKQNWILMVCCWTNSFQRK